MLFDLSEVDPVGILNQLADVRETKFYDFNVLTIARSASAFALNFMERNTILKHCNLQKYEELTFIKSEHRNLRLRFYKPRIQRYGSNKPRECSDEELSGIIDSVDDRIKQHALDQARFKRDDIVDRRFHCCLYTFHFRRGRVEDMKPREIDFILKLQQRVNIIFLLTPWSNDYWKGTNLGHMYRELYRNWFFDLSRKYGFKNYAFTHMPGESDRRRAAIEMAQERGVFWVPIDVICHFTAHNGRVLARDSSWKEYDVTTVMTEFTLLLNLLYCHCAVDLVDSTPSCCISKASRVLLKGIGRTRQVMHQMMDTKVERSFSRISSEVIYGNFSDATLRYNWSCHWYTIPRWRGCSFSPFHAYTEKILAELKSEEKSWML